MTERVESADAPPSGRRLAFGAGALGMISIIKLGLQAASLPLMARLLGPSEIGLYALAIPVVAFVTMLADGGLGISLTREPESSRVWSTAFWVLLFTGIALGLLLTAIGFAEGYLIHQPRVPGLMAALSVTVVFMTITVPSLARLDRQGRIAVGGFADLAANLFGICVGMTLAFRGAGAWSLVAQYVSLFVVRAAIINSVAFVKPKLEFHPHLLLTHLTAGGLVVGTRMADYFGRMVENLVVGQTLGTATLGRYSFSNQITRYVTEMVTNPLWMTLYIRALRAERARWRRCNCSSAGSWGFSCFPSRPSWWWRRRGGAGLPGIEMAHGHPADADHAAVLCHELVSGLSGAVLLAKEGLTCNFTPSLGRRRADYGGLSRAMGRHHRHCLRDRHRDRDLCADHADSPGRHHRLPPAAGAAEPCWSLRRQPRAGGICWLFLRHEAPSLARIGLAAVLGALTYFAAASGRPGPADAGFQSAAAVAAQKARMTLARVGGLSRGARPSNCRESSTWRRA